MGLRFRKSIKVMPGVRATVGRKSASVSIGGRGAASVSERGATLAQSATLQHLFCYN